MKGGLNDGGFEASQARRALVGDIIRVFGTTEARAHVLLLTLLTAAVERQLPVTVQAGAYLLKGRPLRDVLREMQLAVPEYALLPQDQLYTVGVRLQAQLLTYALGLP